MHHPLNWLASFDSDTARECFPRQSSIVFSGHLHEADPVIEIGLRGACFYSPGGCLYDSLDFHNPIPASSGQTIRYRLDRTGDRKLNRALHMILVTRKRTHPATIAYIERRLQEGKTRREATRCLKRYLARSLYRLLEHGPPLTT